LLPDGFRVGVAQLVIGAIGLFGRLVDQLSGDRNVSTDDRRDQSIAT
jgi:hypothetical protein